MYILKGDAKLLQFRPAVCLKPYFSSASEFSLTVLFFLAFQDHTKLILCPLMGAVTYINEKREFCTYKMSLIEEYGCCKELASRVRYARSMVEKLMACKSTASAPATAATSAR